MTQQKLRTGSSNFDQQKTSCRKHRVSSGISLMRYLILVVISIGNRPFVSVFIIWHFLGNTFLWYAIFCNRIISFLISFGVSTLQSIESWLKIRSTYTIGTFLFFQRPRNTYSLKAILKSISDRNTTQIRL